MHPQAWGAADAAASRAATVSGSSSCFAFLAVEVDAQVSPDAAAGVSSSLARFGPLPDLFGAAVSGDRLARWTNISAPRLARFILAVAQSAPSTRSGGTMTSALHLKAAIFQRSCPTSGTLAVRNPSLVVSNLIP